VIGGIGVPVESVVTAAFFDGIKSQAGNGCAGKSFYTRQSFLDAVRAYPNFGYYKDYCKKFGVDPGNYITC
jgi:chitinase